MRLRIQIPESVYDRLLNHEDVKAITNFNRDNKKEAYEILSKLSGFDNFWFSMVVDDVSDDELDYHCQMSSHENPINLILNVPESELFIMNFYDFSDLIYFTAEEPDKEKVDTIIKNINSKKDYLRQAVFPILKYKYIEKVL